MRTFGRAAAAAAALALAFALVLAVPAAAELSVSFDPFEAEPNSLLANPLPSFTGNVISMVPEVGKTIKTTAYMTNLSPDTISGASIFVWANLTTEVGCGIPANGDAQFKIPDINPLQTIAVPLKIKAPETPGPATLRVFVDATCTVHDEAKSPNQAAIEYIVAAKGDKKAYFAGATPVPGSYDSGSLQGPRQYPIQGQPFSVELGVANLGTLASEAGVKMTVWSDRLPRPPSASDCGTAGNVTVELPKIPPGKTKAVAVEGLTAPSKGNGWVYALIDPDCKLGPVPTLVWGGYDTAPAAGAIIRGVHLKGQAANQVKTTPKKPKVNATMTAKIKVVNEGAAEGPIGKVALFTLSRKNPLDGSLGYWAGTRCNVTDYVAMADFSDVVLKPGKSKMITIKDVPVPAGPAGWYELSAVLDAACASAIAKDLLVKPAFNAFQVV
ncbi:hypothetical protein Rsub_03562 [Raphidocelis subcapitata]|uniref:CARDB domain-containing protein n=1 Tax=Raphidocelis subcapitata TaxID=307507 RepID=A0A2V0NX35_9CHLO|nr:hypothetical protein Rsub_03562 [Raphidocelis subcapitata]|eukprot:GBF91242.1 hypothetical protein Rsub_03562 [Raphidocelis subcapitata]